MAQPCVVLYGRVPYREEDMDRWFIEKRPPLILWLIAMPFFVVFVICQNIKPIAKSISEFLFTFFRRR